MADKTRRLMLVEPPFYRFYQNTYSLTKCPLSLECLAGVAR